MHEKYDRLLAIKDPHKDIALENYAEPALNIAPLKEAYNPEFLVNLPPFPVATTATVA